MAARFWVGGSGTWDASDTTHWAATSGGAGGASVPGAADTVTLDGNSGGGTIVVNTNFTIVSLTFGAFTGVLDFATNNNNPTMGSCNGSGTGARTLSMGNGTWTLTGNAGTIWNFGTVTNLTLNPGGSTINCTYSGSTGTRTLNTSTAAVNHVKISAGTDILALTSTFLCNDLDFTGFAGTGSLGAVTMSGSLTLGTGMTANSSTSVWTFNATSAKTVTSNGVQNNRPYTFNGVGGTWTLKDNLNLGGATPRALTVQNGTLDAADGGANHNVTCGSVLCSFSTARGIVMGNGTWELQGTGTVWTTSTPTLLTLTPGSSTIKITDTSNTGITFAGGGKTFANIWWSRGASTATNTLTGANTFADFKDDGSAAHTIVFPNSTTTVSSFTVSGSAGNLITLSRTGASGTFTLSKASGQVVRDYLSISNSAATGGASWFAGANSTNGGSNTGWNFIAPPASDDGLLLLM